MNEGVLLFRNHDDYGSIGDTRQVFVNERNNTLLLNFHTNTHSSTTTNPQITQLNHKQNSVSKGKPYESHYVNYYGDCHYFATWGTKIESKRSVLAGQFYWKTAYDEYWRAINYVVVNLFTFNIICVLYECNMDVRTEYS